MRYFSKFANKENGNNGAFFVIFLCVSFTSTLLLLIFYFNQQLFQRYFEKSPDFVHYFLMALYSAYTLALISVYTAYSASLLKTSFLVFLTDVFVRAGQLLLVVIYHLEWISKDLLVSAYLGIFSLQLILLLAYLYRLKAISLKVNWPVFKTIFNRQLLLFGLLMALTAFASLGLKYIDQLLLGHFLGEHAVGIYATAAMICIIIEIPFNSLERIAQPKIAQAWHHQNYTELGKIYEMSSRYLFFAGSVIVCLLWSGIDFIFQLLPDSYSSGKIVFYIISFSSLFNLLTGVNSSIIMFSPKYLATSLFLFILILLSILFHYLFVPLWGLSGAAFSIMISLILFNLMKFFYILHSFHLSPFTKQTGYILCCVLLCLACILLLGLYVNPFLKALLGSGLSLLLFSLLNIKLEIIEEINKVFRRIGILKQKSHQ